MYVCVCRRENERAIAQGTHNTKKARFHISTFFLYIYSEYTSFLYSFPPRALCALHFVIYRDNEVFKYLATLKCDCEQKFLSIFYLVISNQFCRTINRAYGQIVIYFLFLLISSHCMPIEVNQFLNYCFAWEKQIVFRRVKKKKHWKIKKNTHLSFDLIKKFSRLIKFRISIMLI